MAKISYCTLAGCQQDCLSKGSGYACAGIGSTAVGFYTVYKILGGLKYFQASGIEWNLLAIPLGAIVLAVAVSIYLSQFERFDHWYSGVLFGASIPSFLVAISSINTPG